MNDLIGILLRSGVLASVVNGFRIYEGSPVVQKVKHAWKMVHALCGANQRASEITRGWTKMAIGVSTRLISEKETPKKRRKWIQAILLSRFSQNRSDLALDRVIFLRMPQTLKQPTYLLRDAACVKHPCSMCLKVTSIVRVGSYILLHYFWPRWYYLDLVSCSFFTGYSHPSFVHYDVNAYDRVELGCIPCCHNLRSNL